MQQTARFFDLAVCKIGGDKRDRTADLLTASQALSQLSYTPVCPQTLGITGFFGYLVFKRNWVASLVACAPAQAIPQHIHRIGEIGVLTSKHKVYPRKTNTR